MIRSRTSTEGENGQAIVLFAMIVTVLMIFASLVVDIGMLRNDRQILVNAVDSAALAGGTLMPVDGSKPGAAAAVNALVDEIMVANYPGLPAGSWTVGYKCLIGIDTSSPPQPYISRDIPATCDPSPSLGRMPVSGDFQGAGSTRFTNCVPSSGDKCNVVEIFASATQDYTFGRVVGVNQGSTGTVNSAACNGPCGDPPSTPVDLVVLVDRTASMSSSQIANARDAARAVLQVYDPAVQRVALGLLGPSSTTSSCGSPAVQARAVTSALGYGLNIYPADLPKWIPIGFTGTDGDTPAQAWNEAYAVNGVLQSSSHIVSAINCFDNPGGTGTNLTTPVYMAAQYLKQYGRPNVKWGILFETDGEPNYGGTGDPGNYTCAAAVANASAARAIKNANGDPIELYTVGFFDAGSDPNCPDLAGFYNNKNVTRALSDMASTALSPIPDGVANGCIAAENTDQDHFFCQPKTADLATVFSTIATQFAGIRTHLVRLYPVPIVNSVSPSVGTYLGGNIVFLTGKYFSGATRVTFDGAMAGFTVQSDTQIRVITPAGTTGDTVDIIVTTPGGSSPIVAGDRFTYN